MQLFVKTLTGSTLTVDVEESSLVDDLKYVEYSPSVAGPNRFKGAYHSLLLSINTLVGGEEGHSSS
jgi:hypothetical protein